MRRVSELSASDAEAFREIRLEALRLHPDAFGSSFEVEASEPLADFRNRLSRGGLFGGFVGERLMGVAAFSAFGAARLRHKGTLTGMYVRASERGSGLPEEIVNAVLAYARPRVELVQLSVATTNDRAVRFYERLGFAKYATEPRALKLGSEYGDEFLMVKFLVA
jgi:ribosomal protein S18 acetylase RimI-like enzyme